LVLKVRTLCTKMSSNWKLPGYRTQPVAYEQGQFPAPPSAAAAQQPENFWGSFKDMMDRDPQNAWRVINQAQPQVLANKLFVME
jgi:hypothetical protein